MLLALSLIVLLLGWWLLNTESGLRALVKQAQPWVQIESVTGTLESLQLENVRWENDTAKVTVGRIDLRWRPLELLNRRALIEQLHLLQVTVVNQPTPAQANEQAAAWQGVRIPIDIMVLTASLDKLQIKSVAQPPTAITNIRLAARVTNNSLRLQHFSAHLEQAAMTLTGQLDLTAKRNGKVSLQQQLQLDLDTQQVTVHGELNGTWGQLALRQQLRNEHGAQLQIDGEIKHVLALLAQAELQGKEPIQLTGNWQVPFAAQTIGLQGEPVLSQGRVTISGAPHRYTLDLSASSEHEQRTLVTAELSGNGNATHIELTSISANSTNGVLRGSAELDWAAELTGNVDLLLDNFRPAQLYPELPELQKLSGELRARGQFSDTASNYAGLVGELELDSVSGVYNEQALQADAKAIFHEDKIVMENMTLQLGTAEFEAEASLADQLSGTWSLRAPSLAALSPSASGAVSASGTLQGALTSPRLRAHVNGANIAYSAATEKWQAKDFALQADVTVGKPNAPLAVVAEVVGLSRNGEAILPKLTANLTGSSKQHEFSAEAVVAKRLVANHVDATTTQSENGRLEFAVRGSLVDSSWGGEIRKLAVMGVGESNWGLANPVSLRISPQAIDLGETCLVATEQSLCLQYQQAAVTEVAIEREVDFRLQNFDLAVLDVVLKDYALKVGGRLDGEFMIQQAASTTNPLLSADFHAQGLRLRVTSPQLDATSEVADSNTLDEQKTGSPQYRWLDFEQANIQISQPADADELSALATLVLDQSNAVNADLTLQYVLGQGDWRSAPLRAKVETKIGDLSIIPATFLAGVEANGQLDSSLQISGSLLNPAVASRSEVRGAALFIPEAGLNLRDIRLLATSKTNSSIELQGSLLSGEGELTLAGDLDFADLQNPTAALRLAGKDLDLMQTGDIQAVGDLALSAQLADQLILLSGAVKLGQADLQLGPSENVVLASGDVVIVGQEVNAQRIQQRLDIEIDLGENTHLRVAGLDAGLTGKLELRQEPGELLTGRGQINVVDGIYQAYGEELEISKGKLYFDGASIDDPRLELNAVKKVDAITAGVRVRGRASSPELALFSDPSMSDQDVLSVLIFGKPVSNLGSEDSLTLLKIAASLRGNGPDRFSQMTNRLQDSLGLSSLELRLTGETPELVAGKQLSSRFYVGYGYGLLDAAQSLVLRYKISEAWSIQGDFGADSGADLRYQLER